MKYSLLLTKVFALLLFLVSCEEEKPAFFTDTEVRIYQYLDTTPQYSLWKELVDYAGYREALNLQTVDMTCFVVNNDQVKEFLEKKGISAISQLDKEEARRLVGYHILQKVALKFSAFRNGRFEQKTSSGEFLTALFIDDANDAGVYINNVAKITRWDIELANGIIHEVDRVLESPHLDLYELITNNESYKLFKELIDVTQSQSLLTSLPRRASLLVVPDSIYKLNQIESIDDIRNFLLQKCDFGQFIQADSLLKRYVHYHVLERELTTTEFSSMLDDRFYQPQEPYLYTRGLVLHTLSSEDMIQLSEVSGNMYFNESFEDQKAQFCDRRFNIQATNGFMHEINKVIYPQEIAPLPFLVDLTDSHLYPAIADINVYRGDRDFQKTLIPLQVEDYTPNIKWVSVPASKNNSLCYAIANIFNTPGDFVKRQFMHYDGMIADPGLGGYVEFKLPVMPKGTYQVQLFQNKTAFGGKYNVTIDGKAQGKTLSCYSKGADNWLYEDLGTVTFSRTESHDFRLVVVQSGTIEIDRIFFTPKN